MRLSQLITPELSTLLRENPSAVRDVLDEIHPEDLADLVGGLDEERAAELITLLPTDYAAQVFERLDEGRQASLVNQLDVDSAARLVVEMDADERADLYSQLPPDIGANLLHSIGQVDPRVAADVQKLARWPETSAGGLMTTDYVSVRPALRVQDAINEIRRRADEAETVDIVFVIDSAGALDGVLSLRQMLLAEPWERIEDVMTRHVIAVPPEMDQEEVARKLAKYDFNAMPVVGDEGRLLGVITADDILDVLTEEQSEDVHKMGAVEPIREDYFSTTFRVFLRKRAPWLLILFIGGFLTTSAMAAYDAVLAAIAQLSFYVPLLISAGGNSGAQSSTLIIRALATGDVATRDWWQVLVRELVQGITLGLMLAVVGLGRALMMGERLDFAILIGLSLVGIVTMGCVVGAMMPILLHRLGIDPATSSTPFIATLVDVLGIVLYLSLARLILSELMTLQPSSS